MVAVGNKAVITAAPAAFAARVPLVWQKVDLTYGPQTVWAMSMTTSGVLAVSQAAAQGVARQKLLGIVPPPVRLSDSFRVGSLRPSATIGSVGRLVPMKGHHHVIRAAASLQDRFPELRVIVAGAQSRSEPTYPAELKRLAAELGISDRVEFLGHVDRIEDVYDRLSVCVVATDPAEDNVGPEGMPAVLLEGSWAGLPVVATRGGGTGEAVQDGLTGRLVTPGSAEALAAAIAAYLASPESARSAAEAGAAFARRRFAAPILAAQFFDHLRRLVRVRRHLRP